jgi:hypothetical protein
MPAGEPCRRAAHELTVEARDGILAEPFVHERGVLQTPTAPGLGFEVDARVLRRHGHRFSVMNRKRLVGFSIRSRGIKVSKEIDRVRRERLSRPSTG